MENSKRSGIPLPKMAVTFFLILIFSFNSPPALSQESFSLPSIEATEESTLQTYIVHVKKPNAGAFALSEEKLQSYYQSFLPLSISSSNENTNARMVYSYKNVLTGFAAKLTKEELDSMKTKIGFLSAKPEQILTPQTTHSPRFLGLHQELGFIPGSNFGEGVIIGVLDTGVVPSHPSFSDEGMPPPPAKWKGRCDFAVCNNKLIGATSFLSGQRLVPFDEEGHGTHTASTAAGNFVMNATVDGNANGTAVGMAPLAYLAVYKVCSQSCLESDILAALDTAVEDGVDVLSLSLGGGSEPFYADSIAIGAFGAIRNGIFVSCSAGNSGPTYRTLSNEAPWILTVGASTIDRKIIAMAKLGNGMEFEGESLFQPKDFPSTQLLLIYPGNGGNSSASLCGPGALKGIDVKGKIVLCERGGGISRIEKGVEVKNSGGAAMILMNEEADGFSTLADPHVLPATHVSYAAGLQIKEYINSTETPTATILFKGTVIGDSSAPLMASFSSRGPSLASPGILKPDITGPGVSILAAWPYFLENSTVPSEPTFNIISGTSMSCPHLSGIAALLKASHPDWTPAAIKSAIMTTADILNLGNKPIMDQTLSPADMFALGAGHVNPSRANDPGLIYDLQSEDYLPYLCGLGYTDEQVSVIVHQTVNCSEIEKILEGQLNYPSFSIILGSESQSFTRTVTNVGEATSSYGLEIYNPEGIDVIVQPDILEFTEVNQKIIYEVTFRPNNYAQKGTYKQGYLNWVSAKRVVTSPISVFLA